MYLGIFLVLLLVSIFLPLQVIMVFLLPIPVVLLVKNYPIPHFMIAMLALLAVSFLVQPALSIPLTMLALLSGGTIGWALKKERHPYEIWANGTVGFVLGFLAIYLFIELVLNISLLDTFMDSVDESMEMTENLLGALGAEEQNFELIQQQLNNLIQLFPVALVLLSMIYAFITEWFTFKWLNRGNRIENQYTFPMFRHFRFPKAIVWAYFILLLFTLFVGNGMGPLVGAAILNLYHLLGILIALQGLSLIFFYTHVKGQSRALPVIAIITTILFPMMGLYLLRILGIIDLGFALRDRMQK